MDSTVRFAAASAFQEELQGERRLPDAREAVDQVHPVAREPAPEHVVQPGDACLEPGSSAAIVVVHGRSGP